MIRYDSTKEAWVDGSSGGTLVGMMPDGPSEIYALEFQDQSSFWEWYYKDDLTIANLLRLAEKATVEAIQILDGAIGADSLRSVKLKQQLDQIQIMKDVLYARPKL
jgi:hypothetical protein